MAQPLSGAALALLVAERPALAAVRDLVPEFPRDHLVEVPQPSRQELARLAGRIPWLDPVGENRQVVPGRPTAADAHGAMAAIDTGIALARAGVVDALVTAPIAKESIARHVLPGFVGHTDYLAASCGLERYGRALTGVATHAASAATQNLFTIAHPRVFPNDSQPSRELPAAPKVKLASLRDASLPPAGDPKVTAPEGETARDRSRAARHA